MNKIVQIILMATLIFLITACNEEVFASRIILYELISDHVKEVSDVIKCKLALLGDHEV